MANSITQNDKIALLIMDAQRLASRAKELDALGSALLIEAEGNNRAVEHMKQFQDDIDSLNKLARNKSNSDMINRINQQNPSIREIRQENRELKASLEDHQRALEIIMHKYREHTQHKIFENRCNYKELYNEKLSDIIRKQSDKINEMAAVMQKAASIDDDAIYKEIECMNKLKIENQGLRELLKIANDFGSANLPFTNTDNNSTTLSINTNLLPGPSNHKSIQTELDNIDNSNINNDIASTSTSPNIQTDIKFLESLLLKNIPITTTSPMTTDKLIIQNDIEEKVKIENNSDDDDDDSKMDIDIVLKPDIDLYKTIKKGKTLLQNGGKNPSTLATKIQISGDKNFLHNINNKIDNNDDNITKQKTITPEILCNNTKDKLIKTTNTTTTPENVIQLLEDVCNENNYDESETDDDSTIHNLSNGSTTNEESSDDENNINDLTIFKSTISISKSPSKTNEIIEDKLSS